MIDIKACLRDAEEMMQMTIMHLEEDRKSTRLNSSHNS